MNGNFPKPSTPPQGTEVIIQARNLTRRFDSFVAVNNIDFDIHQGEIVGFLGPNGAGKTTTIKMIMGLLQISSGQIFVKGMDVRTSGGRTKRLLGYMSQKFSLYPLLNSYENVEFAGGISRLPRQVIREKMAQIAVAIPEPILKLKVRDIPPGIRQKVALFVCVMTDPEIILLDEPTSGVDPEVRRKFWDDIYQLKKKGKTVMVTTHYLDEAEYADRILLINQGEIILSGEPAELMKELRADSMEILFKDAIRRHEAT